MMNIKRLASLVALVSISLLSHGESAPAATSMSLEQCLEYAKSHSITLQQSRLEVEDMLLDEASAKAEFLPSISASVSQGITSEPIRAIDHSPATNYSGSYGADLAMTLYNGGANSSALKQSRVSTAIAKEGVAEQESILEIDITQLYVEILYAKARIGVAEQSIALAQRNIERGDVMREVGSLNEADYAQLLSAEAMARYDLVVAQTELSSKYLDLKHLLEIPNTATLEISEAAEAELDITRTISPLEEVYAAALDSRPEIKSSLLSIESAELNERIAKAGFMPTLSLSAGVGVSHSTGSDYTFSNQLKSNYSNSVGLNLSVPIFNKNKTRYAVKQTQIAIASANLGYQDQTKSLYQTIESLHTNAINALSMYDVSKSKLYALERSLALVTEQYEVGMKSIIELLTEQDDFTQSSQEYLESRYTFMLNRALLEYYKTGIIKL